MAKKTEIVTTLELRGADDDGECGGLLSHPRGARKA